MARLKSLRNISISSIWIKSVMLRVTNSSGVNPTSSVEEGEQYISFPVGEITCKKSFNSSMIRCDQFFLFVNSVIFVVVGAPLLLLVVVIVLDPTEIEELAIAFPPPPTPPITFLEDPRLVAAAAAGG